MSEAEPPVDYIELNLSNYTSDDVAQLNEWGVWAHERIATLESEARIRKAMVDVLKKVDLPRQTLLILVRAAYRAGDISRGKAAELLGECTQWVGEQGWEIEQ